jgi:hypothetical protein
MVEMWRLIATEVQRTTPMRRTSNFKTLTPMHHHAEVSLCKHKGNTLIKNKKYIYIIDINKSAHNNSPELIRKEGSKPLNDLAPMLSTCQQSH